MNLALTGSMESKSVRNNKLFLTGDWKGPRLYEGWGSKGKKLTISTTQTV